MRPPLAPSRAAASVLLVLVASCAAASSPAREDPRLAYARELARRLPIRCELRVDARRVPAGPEAYTIRRGSGPVAVVGGGPAGVLYGVQELLRSPSAGRLREMRDAPAFEVRGNALLLMKDANYNYQLTPAEFPWFYDRAFLTRYLDFLFEHRFNAVFLWSGNLFPSIVEVPEYPDSTDLPRDQLLRNQEQFEWFTRECARRNISVLVHFYQIHIPVPLARSRGIPVTYSKPNPFVSAYMRTVLLRFLRRFPSVGLYVCPGEALSPRYQPEWIRDVIFAAAKQSGAHPLVVVRDWTLDAARFKRVCVGQYDRLYTERKHNMEMLVSPTPDDAHRAWVGVARRHIVNVHEAADVKPFRWGSPAFVQEMARHWKALRLSGCEAYGMVSWRWPYTMDRLQAGQSGLSPAGLRLSTVDRDSIWLAALGRYLWNPDRPAAGEQRYWQAWLGKRFGSMAAGRALLDWYETTGPVLPGFQNLTSVLNMNFYPTAVAKEQTVDAILAARTSPGSPIPPAGNYPSRPVDDVFLARYRQAYPGPPLRSRLTMPVSEYGDRLAARQRVSDRMTPANVSRLLVRMADEGLALAEQAARAATRNRDEAARFVTDSRASALVARAWDCKVRAAIHKRLWQRTGSPSEARACLAALRDSVQVYRDLVALTDRTYLNATDMLASLSWHNGLTAFEKDLADQERELGPALRGDVIWGEPGAFTVWGPVGTAQRVAFALPARLRDRPVRIEFKARDLDGANPGDEGVLQVGEARLPLPPTGDGATKPLAFDLPSGAVKGARAEASFVLAHKPGNTIGYSVSDCRLVALSVASGKPGPPPILSAQERTRMLDGYFDQLTGPRPFAFANRQAWEARRKELRAKVRRWLALDPWPERVPLDVHWGGDLDRGDYRVRRVYFQTWPGFYASGWLYAPKAPGKRPVVLNPHGHWANGALEPVVQARLIALAKLGYLALAVDAVHLDGDMYSVTPLRSRALLLGVSDATVQVWNLVRALDFLATLPSADMTRLGCTGESGGGLQTLYLMCVDNRLTAAAPAVYVSNVRGFMEPSTEMHCMCNYVPGVLAETDMPELAATFAPKPALYLNVTGDWTAQVPRREYPQIRSVYALLGAPDNTACLQWESQHDYPKPMREAMYAWFGKHLCGGDGPVDEPTAVPEPVAALQALDRPPAGARPWQELTPYLWERHIRPAKRTTARRLARLLGDAPVSGALDGPATPLDCDGLPAEALRVRSEKGIVVPAWLFRPRGADRPRIVVLLAPGGKAGVVQTHRDLVDALLARGLAVLAPDVRLTGELARSWTRYTVFWGRPEAGMALTDLRACLDALAARPDLDPRGAALVGLGDSGATALLVGALEPRFAGVAVEHLGRAYAAGRTSPLVAGLANVTDLPDIASLVAPRRLAIGGADPAEFSSPGRRAGVAVGADILSTEDIVRVSVPPNSSTPQEPAQTAPKRKA